MSQRGVIQSRSSESPLASCQCPWAVLALLQGMEDIHFMETIEFSWQNLSFISGYEGSLRARQAASLLPYPNWRRKRAVGKKGEIHPLETVSIAIQ